MRRFLSLILTLIPLLCAAFSFYLVHNTALLIDETNDLIARRYMIHYLNEVIRVDSHKRSNIIACIQRAPDIRDAESCIPEEYLLYRSI